MEAFVIRKAQPEDGNDPNRNDREKDERTAPQGIIVVAAGFHHQPLKESYKATAEHHTHAEGVQGVAREGGGEKGDEGDGARTEGHFHHIGEVDAPRRLSLDNFARNMGEHAEGFDKAWNQSSKNDTEKKDDDEFDAELEASRNGQAQLAFHGAEFAFLGDGDGADDPREHEPQERHGFNGEAHFGIARQGIDSAEHERGNVQNEQAEADEESDLVRLEFFAQQRGQR